MRQMGMVAVALSSIYECRIFDKQLLPLPFNRKLKNLPVLKMINIRKPRCYTKTLLSLICGYLPLSVLFCYFLPKNYIPFIAALVHMRQNNSSSTSIDVRPSHELNIFAVFLHILQHVFVALIVITSALIVIFAKGSWIVYIDPSLSLVVVIVMLKTSLPLLKECIVIFMQAVPTNLQLKNTEERLIQKVQGVIGVHELHIWQLAGDQIVGM